MHVRRLGLAGFSLFSAILMMPAAAFAQATCAQLNTDPALGLAGNPTILEHTTTLVPAAGANAAYCRVDFVVSERGGPANGYAAGEVQRVGLRVGLPLNSTDGGSGGGPLGQGAWNGKVRNLGGGGLVGAVGSVTNATNNRYVGSSTDSGHVGNNPSFGVIQETHELDLGKIEDFFSESLRLQYQWALKLAQAYYAQPAARNYWDGCSTGGRQGLVLASKYGDDFDGFLIGAPHSNHTRNSSGGTFRSWANKDITNLSVTDAKYTATINTLVAACDAQDGVVDGLLSQPLSCKASAKLNVCGQPGAAAAPNCLTPLEADVIDIALDGPRNDLGKRVWFPSGRATSVSMNLPANGQGGNGIFAWANKDLDFDWRTTGPRSNWDDLLEQATNTISDYVDMSTSNFDLVRNSGGKILMWHGLADPLIAFQSNIYFYSKVLDAYGGPGSTADWYRFFLAPGVGHCGGGAGPQPQNLFETMVAWAEGGPAPSMILSSGGGRTRPLCPFPQTAIYDGTGDPNLASSFSCGGNIQTKEQICDGLITKHKHETEAGLEPLLGENDVSCGFAFVPQTQAMLSPAAKNGWYRNPLVTLAATDRDNDVSYTEYQLDSASNWTRYTGPFTVTGDGSHTLLYRSVDQLGHTEATQTLTFKNDATAPVIAGMPVACDVWPPNNKMVQVATVTASDATSGLAGAAAIGVSSNEGGSADYRVVGGVVSVRASRSGGGDGRVYVITAHAEDVAGNTADATASCVVPHDRGHK
jgi:hypothetical protein